MAFGVGRCLWQMAPCSLKGKITGAAPRDLLHAGRCRPRSAHLSRLVLRRPRRRRASLPPQAPPPWEAVKPRLVPEDMGLVSDGRVGLQRRPGFGRVAVLPHTPCAEPDHSNPPLRRQTIAVTSKAA